MSGSSLLRRWGFPAAAALLVIGLIVFTLVRLPSPSTTTPPAPSPPAKPSPSGPDDGSATPTAQLSRCHDTSLSWHTTAQSAQVFTHRGSVELAPGSSVTRFNVDPVVVLRSTVVRRSGRLVVSAQSVLNAVQREHKITIAPLDSVTPSAGLSLRPPKTTTRLRRAIAGYSGRTTWQGTWTLRWCDGMYRQTTTGTWASFESTVTTAVALCRSGRYDVDHPRDAWARKACLEG